MKDAAVEDEGCSEEEAGRESQEETSARRGRSCRGGGGEDGSIEGEYG
jgi:hypothetical protein